MSRRLAGTMFTHITGYAPLAHADEAIGPRTLQGPEEPVKPAPGVQRTRKVNHRGRPAHRVLDALAAVEGGVDLQRQAHERNKLFARGPLLRAHYRRFGLSRRGLAPREERPTAIAPREAIP